jgi:hypothetical protein
MKNNVLKEHKARKENFTMIPLRQQYSIVNNIDSKVLK